MNTKSIKKILKKYPTLFFLVKKIKNRTYDVYLKKKRNTNFLKNAKSVLFDFDNAFSEAGIEYWLFFGTLLGAVREKGFIGHDLDIDVGMLKKDYSDRLEEILKKYGFKKTREFLIDSGDYGMEQTYTKDRVSIDLFFFNICEDKMYCHLFDTKDENGKIIDIETNGGFLVRELSYNYMGLDKIDFLGKEFLAPKNIEEVLVSDYGVDYMIPDPNYVSGKRKNVKYLNNKKGVLIVN